MTRWSRRVNRPLRPLPRRRNNPQAGPHPRCRPFLLRESDLQAAILLRFARGATRLFRINAGMGWTGKVARRTRTSILLANPRPFHGAQEGYADLTGWTSITITPDMVGRKVAVFTAIEVKAPGGRERRQQARFREAVARAGGIAVVARTLEAVAEALKTSR